MLLAQSRLDSCHGRAGGWRRDLAALDQADLSSASGIIDQSSDQAIGLADASPVVLAHRYRTERLLTLDHRHFRMVRRSDGKPFTVLPSA